MLDGVDKGGWARGCARAARKSDGGDRMDTRVRVGVVMRAWVGICGMCVCVQGGGQGRVTSESSQA